MDRLAVLQSYQYRLQLSARTGVPWLQVGLSGSGKSTLVAMLARLYDPTSGQVSARFA